MNQREIRKTARELIRCAVLDLEGEPWVASEDSWLNDLEGYDVRSVFLGTVFQIMPSGKYYMPWACSNVEACPRCKGAGCDYCGSIGSREAFEDELMQEALEHYAQKKGVYVEGGEGDPCDLFVSQIRE